MKNLYTIGYTGRTLDELADIAKRHGAGIADIRFSTWSRDAKWRHEALAKSMEFRSVEYNHLPALGNVNYRDHRQPIVIARPEAGLYDLRSLLHTKSQILLCACPDPAKCHRSTVAAMMLEKFGIPAVHLDAKAESGGGMEQGSLF